MSNVRSTTSPHGFHDLPSVPSPSSPANAENATPESGAQRGGPSHYALSGTRPSSPDILLMREGTAPLRVRVGGFDEIAELELRFGRRMPPAARQTMERMIGDLPKSELTFQELAEEDEPPYVEGGTFFHPGFTLEKTTLADSEGRSHHLSMRVDAEDRVVECKLIERDGQSVETLVYECKGRRPSASAGGGNKVVGIGSKHVLLLSSSDEEMQPSGEASGSLKRPRIEGRAAEETLITQQQFHEGRQIAEMLHDRGWTAVEIIDFQCKSDVVEFLCEMHADDPCGLALKLRSYYENIRKPLGELGGGINPLFLGKPLYHGNEAMSKAVLCSVHRWTPSVQRLGELKWPEHMERPDLSAARAKLAEHAKWQRWEEACAPIAVMLAELSEAELLDLTWLDFKKRCREAGLSAAFTKLRHQAVLLHHQTRPEDTAKVFPRNWIPKGEALRDRLQQISVGGAGGTGTGEAMQQSEETATPSAARGTKEDVGNIVEADESHSDFESAVMAGFGLSLPYTFLEGEHHMLTFKNARDACMKELVKYYGDDDMAQLVRADVEGVKERLQLASSQGEIVLVEYRKLCAVLEKWLETSSSVIKEMLEPQSPLLINDKGEPLSVELIGFFRQVKGNNTKPINFFSR